MAGRGPVVATRAVGRKEGRELGTCGSEWRNLSSNQMFKERQASGFGEASAEMFEKHWSSVAAGRRTMRCRHMRLR